MERLKEQRVSKKEILCYGMGSLGNNIIYAFISTYLLIYYTDYFGINAAAVGTLFLMARIWDAANDPIMGIIVDNTHTRWGKFRPYLLIVPFFMAGATILCFLNPELSVQGKLVYAYVTYIAWGMSFTAMDIPYWSMSAAITQDPQERNHVVMVPRTMAVVGFFIVNVLTLPLVKYFQTWHVVAILYSIVAIVLTLITFFNVKEKVIVKRDKKQTIKDVIHLFRVNRPLRLLIWSMLITETINALRFTFTIYYLKYNLESEELVPAFLGAYLLLSIFGSIASPILSKRLGKKGTAWWGMLIQCISSIGMFFTGFGSFLPILLWNSIGAFSSGASNIAQTSMLVDCVEYGEWKTGNRAEGMVFSTNIFKTKLASAIGGALGAYALSIMGYVPNVQQSMTTLNSMHMIFTLIPGVLSLFSLIPLGLYDLTEDQYKKVLGELLRVKAVGGNYDEE